MRSPFPTLALITAIALATVAATWRPMMVIEGDTLDWVWWRWRIVGMDAIAKCVD